MSRYVRLPDDVWYDRTTGTYSSPHPDIQRRRYPGMKPLFDFVDGQKQLPPPSGLGDAEQAMTIADKIGIGGLVVAGLLGAGAGALAYFRARNRPRLNAPDQARYEGYQWAMVASGVTLLLGAGFLHSLAV